MAKYLLVVVVFLRKLDLNRSFLPLLLRLVLLILGRVNLKLDMSLNNAFVSLSPYSYSRIVGE